MLMKNSNTGTGEYIIYKGDYRKHRGNKYTICFCPKKTEFMLGANIYKYLNLPSYLILITIGTLGLFINISLGNKIFAFFLVIICIYIPISEYLDVKKFMINHGHSILCSKKIAYMRMLRSSLWSEFKIMPKSSEENK